MPRLCIISGCNGSGKTTASYTLLPELLDCSEFVNPDEFAKHISPFSPENAYITAARLMLRKVDYLFMRKEDFCIESTLATRALLKTLRKAREEGYYTTVLYFWLDSPERAIARVASRVRLGGHDIPEETVRRRYFMGLNYLFNNYMNACDKWILADNSTPPFRRVAEGTPQGEVIHDAATFEAIRAIALANPPIHVPPPVTITPTDTGLAPHDGVPFGQSASHD